MATTLQQNGLSDEIRFRCEGELKERLKVVAKQKRGSNAKYQAVAREEIWRFVRREERRLGLEGGR